MPRSVGQREKATKPMKAGAMNANAKRVSSWLRVRPRDRRRVSPGGEPVVARPVWVLVLTVGPLLGRGRCGRVGRDRGAQLSRSPYAGSPVALGLGRAAAPPGPGAVRVRRRRRA